MAMAVAAPREQPKFVLVRDYSISRIGKFPMVRVVYGECVYLADAAVSVTSMVDANADGQYEALTVAELVDSPSLVGAALALPDSTPIGTVTAHTVVGGAAKLVLDTPTSLDLTGDQILVVGRMPVGTPTYRIANGGRQWETILHGENTDAMSRMATMLRAIYVNAGRALLNELGMQSTTTAAISAAVDRLAAKGTNMDGFFANEGETLETERMASGLPFATVIGDFPS